MKNEKGFTLIELIMVMVILAILSAVAVPKFFDLQGEAKQANEDGMVGTIRTGILTSFAKNKVFPATLDGAAVGNCTEANKCFTDVLGMDGVVSQWSKLSGTTYRSPVNGTNVWTYDNATGAFTKTTS